MSHGDKVRSAILSAGVRIWARNPHGLNAGAIARVLGMSRGAVSYHFRTAEALRDALAAHALATGESRVIVQLLACDHPTVAKMPLSERERHMQSVG